MDSTIAELIAPSRQTDVEGFESSHDADACTVMWKTAKENLHGLQTATENDLNPCYQYVNPTLGPTISVDRFASCFNLGVRYWDKNMPVVALREFYRAMEVLESVGLPTTCINHSIRVVRQTMSSTRRAESELVAILGGRKKNNLPLNYKLATLFFDRRMLETADKWLKRCKDLAQTLLNLAGTRRAVARSDRSSRECDFLHSARRSSIDLPPAVLQEDEGYSQAESRLEGIIRDLGDLKQLQGLFCTLTQEVKVLPCLLARFTEDVSECEEWWTAIRSSDQIIW